jgi:hypothetical protein
VVLKRRERGRRAGPRGGGDSQSLRWRNDQLYWVMKWPTL